MKHAAVMFHHFFGRGHPRGQGAIGAEDLAELIERHGRDNFVPPRDWMLGHGRGRQPDNALCLTFDDGLRCQLDVALPVLEHYKPAFPK